MSQLILYRIVAVKLDNQHNLDDWHTDTLCAHVIEVDRPNVASVPVLIRQARMREYDVPLRRAHFLYQVGDELYYKPNLEPYHCICRTYGSTEGDPVFQFEGPRVNPTYAHIGARRSAYETFHATPDSIGDQQFDAMHAQLMAPQQTRIEKRYIEQFLFASLPLIYRQEWNDSAIKERVLRERQPIYLDQPHHARVWIETWHLAHKSSAIASFVTALFMCGNVKIRILCEDKRARDAMHARVTALMPDSPAIIHNKSQIFTVCGESEIQFDTSEQSRCMHRPPYDITFVDEVHGDVIQSDTSPVLIVIGTPTPHQSHLHFILL